MYKIAALAYKAKIGDGHLVDDAINIWTALFNIPLPSWRVWRKDTWGSWWKKLKEWFRGSYSHIELWISDKNGNFIKKHYAGQYRVKGLGKATRKKLYREYLGQCFTSTMRDRMKGTVLRPASEVIKHPDRWDVGVIYQISYEEYEQGMEHINYKVETNKGYDKLCIADFFNPLRRWLPLHSKIKQICSEAFQYGLFAFVWLKISEHICSPRRIVRILKKRGVVFTPVTEL